ncbi:MAG: hypothetical protein FWE01_01810 [Firmicutes bacterium]|nr:hypothetical protein [Bacillota bacterium]
MNILIASNLTIRSNEVLALAKALRKKHQVTICTMASEASYKGLAFTTPENPVRGDLVTNLKMQLNILEVLEFTEHSKGKENSVTAYEFYGNPADMISIMLGEVMKERPPELVICGISNSTNMGPDIYSSSNVGMAMMATYMGVRSIVVGTDFVAGGHSIQSLENVAQFVEKNINEFVKASLPGYTLLNINVPEVENFKDINGIKFTRMGKMNLSLQFEEKTCPAGVNYFWAKKSERENLLEDCLDDKCWYDKGYVSITPLNVDATDWGAIDNWGKVVKELKKNV